MPLTPERLPRHELIGLPVRVVDAANPDLVGIAGRVVRETAGTLVVESVPVSERSSGRSPRDAERSGRQWQVPKRAARFEFACTDEAAPFDSHEAKNGGTAAELGSDTAGGTAAGQSGPCEVVAYVTVDGARLLSRPALRTETTGDSRWR
jgi:ribonuclease P protein subunit POP4